MFFGSISMARLQGPNAAAFDYRKQGVTRAGDAAHDRANWNIQQFGGLAITESSYVNQGDYFAMCRGEHGKTLLHGDFCDLGVVEAPEINTCKIVRNVLSLAAELIKSSVADNAEHPGAIGWRIGWNSTSGKGPRRRFLYEITGGIRIAQHGAGESE